MVRDVAIYFAAIVACQVACAGAHGASVTERKVHGVHHSRISAIVAEAAHWAAGRPRVPRGTVETSSDPTSDEPSLAFYPDASATIAPSSESVPHAPQPSLGQAPTATFETSPGPAPDLTPTPLYLTPPAASATSLDGSHSLPVPLYQSPPGTFATSTGAASELPPELSDQEQDVSQMADARGDRNFLMVDKTLGKIILFENGEPIFAGAALTGASTADRLPPGALTEKFSRLNALDTKVTPAGRFTVSRGYDKDYGPLLDVNEIRGKDWGIAIHKVYLGIPSEHRDARLRSPNEQDKHITFGCINVTPRTIQFLLRELARNRKTPLYILPEEETRTAAYFAAQTS